MIGDSLYFQTGPYGSVRDRLWFTDFSQSLDGKSWQPIHWPDKINIQAGQAIDG